MSQQRPPLRSHRERCRFCWVYDLKRYYEQMEFFHTMYGLRMVPSKPLAPMKTPELLSACKTAQRPNMAFSLKIESISLSTIKKPFLAILLAKTTQLLNTGERGPSEIFESNTLNASNDTTKQFPATRHRPTKNPLVRLPLTLASLEHRLWEAVQFAKGVGSEEEMKIKASLPVFEDGCFRLPLTLAPVSLLRFFAVFLWVFFFARTFDVGCFSSLLSKQTTRIIVQFPVGALEFSL